PPALKMMPSAFLTRLKPTPKQEALLVTTWTVALVSFCSRAATPSGIVDDTFLPLTTTLPLPAIPPVGVILVMPSVVPGLSLYLKPLSWPADQRGLPPHGAPARSTVYSPLSGFAPL